MTQDEHRDVTASEAAPLVIDLPGGPLALTFTASDGGEDRPLADEMRRLWAHARTTGRPTGETETLEIKAAGPHRSLAEPDEDLLLVRSRQAIERDTYAASGRITRALVCRLVGTKLLLHAGTVHREDTGIVTVIGPSGAGKSTAISTFGRGHTYLSDELTILDPETFAITGYVKPVSRATPAGYKRDVALSELGLRPAFAAGAPDHIVLLRRDPERTEPARLTRCALPTALVRITEQSSSLWRLPRPLETVATLLDSVGGALEAQYRESGDLPELLLAPPPRQHEDWSVIDPAETISVPAEGQVTVTGFRQALVTEGGAVVLRDHRVVHLTGLNALVWELLAEHGPLTSAEITDALVATIGEHPDAADFTKQALLQLEADLLISGSLVPNDC